jgi:hypothetical protein
MEKFTPIIGRTPGDGVLRSARLGCGVTAVTITGGEKESGSGAAWNVPKRDLIAGCNWGSRKANCGLPGT